MSDETRNNDNTPEEAATEWDRAPRAMALFADSRACDLLMTQTVGHLAASHGIEHAYIELYTPAGIAAAQYFKDAGIAYTVMSIGDKDIDDEDPVTAGLLAAAASIAQIDPLGAAGLPASLVIVPASVGSGQEHLDAMVARVDRDLSPNTLPGVVLEAAQAAERDMMMIDPPEHGLVCSSSGSYRRRIFHIGYNPSSERSHASPEDS